MKYVNELVMRYTIRAPKFGFDEVKSGQIIDAIQSLSITVASWVFFFFFWGREQQFPTSPHLVKCSSHLYDACDFVVDVFKLTLFSLCIV